MIETIRPAWKDHADQSSAQFQENHFLLIGMDANNF